jgi:hypothetical protein
LADGAQHRVQIRRRSLRGIALNTVHAAGITQILFQCTFGKICRTLANLISSAEQGARANLPETAAKQANRVSFYRVSD